jgi:hypothetical protein
MVESGFFDVPIIECTTELGCGGCPSTGLSTLEGWAEPSCQRQKSAGSEGIFIGPNTSGVHREDGWNVCTLWMAEKLMKLLPMYMVD